MAAHQPGFREFVTARSAAAMRTAFLLTGDWQRAEDLLQTALLHCLPRWDRIDDHEAYLRRTLVRTYAGWRRRRWVGEPRPTRCRTDLTAARRPARRTCGQTSFGCWARCRHGSEPWWSCATTRTWPEVAELLGVSPGTVKSSAARGLTRLRRSPLVSALVKEAKA